MFHVVRYCHLFINSFRYEIYIISPIHQGYVSFTNVPYPPVRQVVHRGEAPQLLSCGILTFGFKIHGTTCKQKTTSSMRIYLCGQGGIETYCLRV